MMTSEELAAQIANVYLEANRRILSTGHDQYAREHDSAIGEVTHQRYEIETLDDELTGLEEELLDTINWAAMAILKLRERRERA